MISFEEALSIVETVDVLPIRETVAMMDSIGRILAEDVYSDVDMPPFDKAAVDGYACRKADLPGPLELIETIAAGVTPTKRVLTMQCSKIMTGAIVPAGADCIIMIEHTRINDNGTILFLKQTTGNNIAYKSEDVRLGQLVLQKGTCLKPQHIAIMASVGCTMPSVYRIPAIGILTTGDELVEPDIVPQGAQIRNSNAYQLMAQAGELGSKICYGGIVPDDIYKTTRIIQETLDKCDVLLITGGVSMGEYDHVPSVMESLGFDIRFRHMAVQPGKPTLFATREEKYVFGLPGNPVSSFVQFELTVKPLLYRIMGTKYNPRIVTLPMATGYTRKKTDRKSFIPVKYASGKIEPLEYHGSAHIHSFEQAWGIISMNIGEDNVKPGELREVRQI
ncbi:MAG TPA: gephyrin-like molybdotransferase Glp [Lentimicrobium sp.]|nr:gephyrin-like molybdotransferase Glp [Lentimicrobium sp.]